MIVDDVDIETRKFKMYAEKADTEADRIELCKKYLKVKGLVVMQARQDFTPRQMPEEIDAVRHNMMNTPTGTVETFTVSEERGMFELDLDPRLEYAIKENLARRLVNELLKKDFIKFASSDDLYLQTRRFQGSIHVWKER